MRRTLKKIADHARLVGATVLEREDLLPERARPALAHLRLTNRCNVRCATCSCWRSPSDDAITTERAQGLLRELQRADVPYLRFTGGEPLLRGDLFEILREATPGRFRRITLATNGLLLGKRLAQVNASPLTHVTVSLDGVGRRHDELRGMPGLFERVMEALPRVERPVRVGSIVTGPLADDLEELIGICRDHGWEYDVNLPDTTPYFFACDEVQRAMRELWPTPEQTERILTILERHKVLAAPLLETARVYLTEQRLNFKHCMKGFLDLFVEPGGEVKTGCYVAQPAGNVLEQPLDEILQNEAYQRSARTMFRMECPGCTCGYGMSVVYRHPIRSLGYLRRRMPLADRGNSR